MAAGSTDAFRQARDFLLRYREDYDTAYRGFRWPALTAFNWALDWFDVVAKGNCRTALRIFSEEGVTRERSFSDLSEVSSRVANSPKALGVRRGERILIMLGNRIELWETVLAAMKVGAVVIPATSQLTAGDLEDRFTRGGVKHVVTDASSTPKFGTIVGDYTRIVVGSSEKGWHTFDTLYSGDAKFTPDASTRANEFQESFNL